MLDPFTRVVLELGKKNAHLPLRQRALFLLCYSERYARVFELFEVKAHPACPGQFREVLDGLWDLAAGLSPRADLGDVLDSLIPGEEWVVDGFHDGIAQYVGGMADAAWNGLRGVAIDREPEVAPFSVLRTVLSETELGCLEPGGLPRGVEFDEGLIDQPLIRAELRYWEEALALVTQDDVAISTLRTEAARQSIDPSQFEPGLSAGLEADREGW